MSPEYAIEGQFSEKSDIFSFGVLLLEIVSGKKNTTFYYDKKSVSLLGLVSHLIASIFKTSIIFCSLISFGIDVNNFDPVFIFLGMGIVDCRKYCSINRPDDI